MVGRPPSCLCGECKKCKKRAYMNKWYANKTPEQRRAWINLRDKDRVRAADRERHHNDPERSASSRTYARRWRKEHPEAAKAHDAVARALKTGRLEKKPCWCGRVDNIHAHHEDYTKPLEVEWLCVTHHGECRRIPF